MNTTTTPTPIVHGPGEGQTLTARGTTVTIKCSSERLTVTDHSVPAGFPGPPRHIHPGFSELFYVLEGTLTVLVDDEVHEIEPGGTAYVPGGTPHTFANTSAAPTQFLAAIAPGGFEDYFLAMAAGDEDAAAEVAERFGYKAV